MLKALLNQKPQHQGYPNYNDGPYSYGGPCQPGNGGGGPPNMGPGGPQPPPGYFGGPPNMGPQGSMPSGIKVPDEDLTPQQRLHREEQLAKMRKLQMLLLSDDPQSASHNVPGDSNFQNQMPPHENLDVYNNMQVNIYMIITIK